jgi:hypothetical protein
MAFDLMAGLWGLLCEYREDPCDGTTPSIIRIFNIETIEYKSVRIGVCPMCGVEFMQAPSYHHTVQKHIIDHHLGQYGTCHWSIKGDHMMRALLAAAGLVPRHWAKNLTSKTGEVSFCHKPTLCNSHICSHCCAAQLQQWRALSMFGNPEMPINLENSTLEQRAERYGVMGLVQQYKTLTEGFKLCGRIIVDVPWANDEIMIAQKVILRQQGDGSFTVLSIYAYSCTNYIYCY